jgi:hypothetical protein
VSVTDVFVIPARFNGPLDSGNGGYSSGMFERVADGPATVSLRRPVPLDTPLEVVRDDGAATIRLGGEVIAEVHTADELELTLPDPVDLDQAHAGFAAYRGIADGPFSRCFVCGRARHDSLQVFAGPVEGREVVASPWTPPDWTAGEDGAVDTSIVAGVLDCPTYFAHHREGPLSLAVLARFQVRHLAPVPAGEEHVVVGWPLERDGRKLHAAAAISTADGTPLAIARALMIEPRA